MDTPTSATRLIFDTTLTLDGTPDAVFPLLCPVREYDWIPDWSCTMVHSTSGVAELGCVFTRERDETWITTLYDPPGRIEYTIVSPGIAVRTLGFTLAPSGRRTTTVKVRSTATALSAAGAADVLGWTAADQLALWTLREGQANHYLRTGTAKALSPTTA